jgi:hypothetical protein
MSYLLTSPIPTLRRVDLWDLRRLFNEGKYLSKIRQQKLTARSVRCNAVSATSPYIGKTIPLGSISQTLELLDPMNNSFIAEIQRYIKPDGRIGASGKNDPKKLVVGNVEFHQSRPGNPVPKLRSSEINHLLNKRGPAALVTYIKSFWFHYLP